MITLPLERMASCKTESLSRRGVQPAVQGTGVLAECNLMHCNLWSLLTCTSRRVLCRLRRAVGRVPYDHAAPGAHGQPCGCFAVLRHRAWP